MIHIPNPNKHCAIDSMKNGGRPCSSIQAIFNTENLWVKWYTSCPISLVVFP